MILPFILDVPSVENTIRDDFRSLAEDIRGISGPDGLDHRPSYLRILTRTWAGGLRGSDGGYSESALTLPDIYHFRQVRTDEIAGSGGRYETGDIKVGPITPAFTGGGGFTEAQLKPSPPTGTEVVYQVVGQHTGEYNLVEFQSIKNYSWYLILRRRRTSP